MLRLLIAANLHLDRPLVVYTPSARQRRREESLLSLQSIVDEAVNRQIDGVIIAGNLFHTPYPSPLAWEAVKKGSSVLQSSGIPLLLLAGEYDDGPFYQNPMLLENLQLLSGGMSKEFLPGLNVSVGTQPPIGGGVLRWRGAESPQPFDGTLTIIPGQNWNYGESDATLTPGAPLKLDFDGPEDPSVTLLTWDQGVVSIEQILLPDRVYATVRWDVEERGTDIAPYLEERLDGELALRLLVYGHIEEALSIEEIERKFQSGFFHLSIVDQTNLSPKAITSSPLANDKFNKLIGDALANPELSEDETRRYFRAWVLGQNAFKGGEKRAN